MIEQTLIALETINTKKRISKESDCHHSIGSPMNGAHPSPNSDRDYLMKDNLGSILSGTSILSFPLSFQSRRTVTAQIIFHQMNTIGLWTWVRPVYQALYAVMMVRFFQLSPFNKKKLSPTRMRVSERCHLFSLPCQTMRE